MRMTKPERAGFSSTRLRRISTVMQAYIDEGKLAGMITAVARRGRLVHLDKRAGWIAKIADRWRRMRSFESGR